MTQAISSCDKNTVKPRDEIQHVQSICAAAFHSCFCKSQSGLADVGCYPPTHRSCPHGSLSLAPLTLACAAPVSNPTAARTGGQGTQESFAPLLFHIVRHAAFSSLETFCRTSHHVHYSKSGRKLNKTTQQPFCLHAFTAE